MTREEKQLLLKDLCARLPYGIICKETLSPGTEEEETTNVQLAGAAIELFIVSEEIDIKPYLRPMSSMTEEECITLSNLIPYETDAWKYIKTPVPLYIANIEQFDFFHRRHLDWRGLIPKGLALEAPEGMYKTE